MKTKNMSPHISSAKYMYTVLFLYLSSIGHSYVLIKQQLWYKLIQCRYVCKVINSMNMYCPVWVINHHPDDITSIQRDSLQNSYFGDGAYFLCLHQVIIALTTPYQYSQSLVDSLPWFGSASTWSVCWGSSGGWYRRRDSASRRPGCHRSPETSSPQNKSNKPI